jgi:hypothetical protein
MAKEEAHVRFMIALVLLAASAGHALAGDETAKVDQAALAPAQQQQTKPQQAPAENNSVEQSFYGFSGNCAHRSVKEDTAKLLMN